MRVVIDSEITRESKQVWGSFMMEWETVLIITLDYYIDNFRFRQNEIKIKAAGTNVDYIQAQVMRIIERREWEGTVRLDMPRTDIKDSDMTITDIELRDTAGVLAWLRDMKAQLKNLLNPISLKR